MSSPREHVFGSTPRTRDREIEVEWSQLREDAWCTLSTPGTDSLRVLTLGSQAGRVGRPWEENATCSQRYCSRDSYPTLLRQWPTVESREYDLAVLRSNEHVIQHIIEHHHSWNWLSAALHTSLFSAYLHDIEKGQYFSSWCILVLGSFS
jgi:hypothetical protein